MWICLLGSLGYFLVEKCIPCQKLGLWLLVDGESVTRDPWGWQTSGVLAMVFLQGGVAYTQLCSLDENTKPYTVVSCAFLYVCYSSSTSSKLKGHGVKDDVSLAGPKKSLK